MRKFSDLLFFEFRHHKTLEMDLMNRGKIAIFAVNGYI